MKTSASEWALTTSVRLSKRYSVDITAGPGGMTAEWDPDLPNPNKLTKQEWRRYRTARDELVARVAERMGGACLVIG
jgi:hypothetical protein